MKAMGSLYMSLCISGDHYTGTELKGKWKQVNKLQIGTLAYDNNDRATEPTPQELEALQAILRPWAT